MAGCAGNLRAVIQNLEDAGCGKETVERFIELEKEEARQDQLKLLEKHRRSLLEKLHRDERQIDCLDYLIFRIKNNNHVCAESIKKEIKDE